MAGIFWIFWIIDLSHLGSLWIQGALEGTGVLHLGGCCGLGRCCTSCAYSIVVWWLYLLKYCHASKLMPPGSVVCCAGGTYHCEYAWAAGLVHAGTGAGACCGRLASCCSLVTPILSLLHSSARKPTVMVVEACFSARPMIYI